VWGESWHTAANTAAFSVKRIESLGARNLIAIVSDTENKMKAAWDELSERYPWMLMIPCASHCFDLLLNDISKNPYVGRPLTFRKKMTEFWRHNSFHKSVLERCQHSEYGKVVQLQRPNPTRWKSQVMAAMSLLKTQVAMEKAVVDGVCKRECLAGGSARRKRGRRPLRERSKTTRTGSSWQWC